MGRVFLFIMDGFGVGGAPDAASFGDEGSNTFTHIAEREPLTIPNLTKLGLSKAAAIVSGKDVFESAVDAKWGVAQELSRGKDTITGHWEIAGVPLERDWGYFPKAEPAFPLDFMNELINRCGLNGFLAMNHASGTDVIEQFGEEHIRSGKPILYTSVDSVIQIAAHETHFGLKRLYDVCSVAREMSYGLNIGRVIARPFVGETVQTFNRTGNRKDYAVLPPQPTLFDHLADAKRDVITIGKIGDIYAHKNTGREIKVSGLETLMQTTADEMPRLKNGGLLMVNFVDFDSQYGHRRDVKGYAAALNQFDVWLGQALKFLQNGDRLVITADHGNDPTWKGTDHTREMVPVLVAGIGLKPSSIGKRESFADIGQSIAQYLGLEKLKSGIAFDIN